MFTVSFKRKCKLNISFVNISHFNCMSALIISWAERALNYWRIKLIVGIQNYCVSIVLSEVRIAFWQNCNDIKNSTHNYNVCNFFYKISSNNMKKLWIVEFIFWIISKYEYVYFIWSLLWQYWKVYMLLRRLPIIFAQSKSHVNSETMSGKFKHVRKLFHAE